MNMLKGVLEKNDFMLGVGVVWTKVKARQARGCAKYFAGDRFELSIVNSADPNGALPVARIVIKGHMHWRGSHPIAAGAQKVDFVADVGYEVTQRSLPRTRVPGAALLQLWHQAAVSLVLSRHVRSRRLSAPLR